MVVAETAALAQAIGYVGWYTCRARGALLLLLLPPRGRGTGGEPSFAIAANVLLTCHQLLEFLWTGFNALSRIDF